MLKSQLSHIFDDFQVKGVDVAMDKYLITPKRKMTEEITENFVST